jgi:protein-tyrosine-phosphatase
MTPSAGKIRNVLFLCTGNSARSIIAEAILNDLGRGRFRAFSAGSHPTGKVNPYALDLLTREGLPVAGLRSKAWDEFAHPAAPQIDFIFTVCDNAAGEVCPIWPGRPLTAHWGIEDPAAVTGTNAQRRQAFELTFGRLRSRIAAFVSLPVAALEHGAIQQQLADIGKA